MSHHPMRTSADIHPQSNRPLALMGALALGASLWIIGASEKAEAVLLSDADTYFTNTGGIINTRHNMSQGTAGSSMPGVRNRYGEVCVYCHTPHGANAENIAAPLWNRTFKNNTYTTYDTLGTTSLTQPVSQPGVSSLTCLSCHDGTVAIDSIINMPGSGKYSAASKTSHQEAFLDGWNGGGAPGTSTSGNHYSMGGASPNTPFTCMSCHNINDEETIAGTFYPTFNAAYIGTDLRNDHPVGITIPEQRIGIDFMDPDVRGNTMAFFDLDADNRADGNEVRFYKSSGLYKVECASCHDPHGIPSAGEGSQNVPTFLRKTNTNSGLCLTCHAM